MNVPRFSFAPIFWVVAFLLPLGQLAGPVPANKPAHFPDWWFDRDVIPRLPAHANNPAPVWPDHYPQADDYAVANLGQLKHIATAADAALDASIPGGSGPAIDGLVGPWALPPAAGVVRDDFAAVNHSQIKHVAKPFYDRIGLTPYPWSGVDADDYAVANLGQLKNVFSFNLSDIDQDQDGMPDTWELLYGLNPLANDALEDLDQDGIPNRFEYGANSNPVDPSSLPVNRRRVPLDYETIQSAIDAAAPYDTIEISSGTYKGLGNRSLRTNGKPLLVIGQGSSTVTLDQEESGDGFATVANLLLKGISFKSLSGPAVHMQQAYLKLEDVVIIQAADFEGSVIEILSAQATINNLEVRSGKAAGIRALDSKLRVSDYRYLSNQVSTGASAVRLAEGSSATLSRISLVDNFSGGPLVSLDETSNNMQLDNSVILRNQSNHGVLWESGTSSVWITHATIADNRLSSTPGVFMLGSDGGVISIQNSIIYNPALTNEFYGSAVYDISHLITSRPFPGTQVHAVDPKLTRSGHLRSTSPAIDIGTTVNNMTKDIDLEARPYASVPDLGADEWIPSANSSKLPAWFVALYGITSPSANSDGDNLINYFEYLAGTKPTLRDSDADGIDDNFLGSPMVYAGENFAIVSGAAFELQGFVYGDSQPNSPSQIQVQWQAFDSQGLPAAGVVEFENPNNLKTLVRVLKPGLFTLRLRASDDAWANLVQDDITVECSGLEMRHGDLVGHWRFEEGGGIHAADDSGNGNIAELIGDSGWTQGTAGQALLIGPGRGMAVVKEHTGLGIEGEITLALWVKMNGASTNVYQRILSTKYSWTALQGYDLSYHTELKRLAFGGFGTQQFIAFDVDLTQGWHHVAFTFKKDPHQPFIYKGAFYVDGERVEDRPFSVAGLPHVTRRVAAYENFPSGAPAIVNDQMRLLRSSGAHFFIGANARGGDNFRGTLDDLRVYPRALDENYIRNIYRDRIGLRFWLKASSANLAAEAPFVRSWTDLAGSGLTLTPPANDARPRFEAKAGQPALVVFDGYDDALEASLPESLSGSSTFFVVARSLGEGTQPGKGILATAGAPSLSSFDLVVNSSNALGMQTYGGRRYDMGYADSSVHLYTIEVKAADPSQNSASTVAIYRDQHLVSIQDKTPAEAQLLSALVLGRGRQAGSFSRVGFAEIQIFDRILQPIERQRIENSLMRDYVAPSARVLELTSPRQSVALIKTAGNTVNVPLRARLLDSARQLDRVDFYVNDILVGSDSQAPYEYIWTEVSIGVHRVTAVAVEARTLLKSDSLSRTITVVPAGAYQILHLPGGEAALDISDMPNLASPAYIAGHGAGRPLLWKSGSVSAIPLAIHGEISRGQAVSVNSSGVAVGWVVPKVGAQKAALWKADGRLTLIPFAPSLAANPSYATHISDTGFVSGNYQASQQNFNTFRYSVSTGLTNTTWRNTSSDDYANYVSNEGVLSGAIGWRRPPVPPGWSFSGSLLSDPVITAEPAFSSGSAQVIKGPPAYPTFTLTPAFPVSTYVQAFQAFLPSLFSSKINAMDGSTWVGQSGYIKQIGYRSISLLPGQTESTWWVSVTKQAHRRTGAGDWQRLSPPTLGGLQSEALDIAQVPNQGHTIVGWSHTAKGAKSYPIPNFTNPGYAFATEETNAFVQIGSGPMQNLNNLVNAWIPPDFPSTNKQNGWVLLRANAVNNQGWIVGEGYLNGAYAAYITALSVDTDGDGLSNLEEGILYSSNGASPSSDADGLGDLQEVLASSNPSLVDSDRDGLPDDWEFLQDINPASALDHDGSAGDPDSDGLSNLREYQLGTAPYKADTDGDGMPDGWEIKYGLNPLNPADGDEDPDSDGLNNRLEWQFDSDPTKADGDVATSSQQFPHPITGLLNTGDGFTDLQEVLLGLNPLIYDAQKPSIARTGLSFWLQSSDSGTDFDTDGLSDFAENIWGTISNNSDTDGDGIPDGWEAIHGLDPRNSADAAQDKDNDGLTNFQEYQLGLLAYDYDTDNDGLGDGWEKTYNLDPKTGRSGLAAWWRFDGAGGVFNDSGNLRHDGLLRGAAKMVSTGRVEGALFLDGKDAYAVVPNQNDLALNDASTVAFWFKPAVGSLNTPRQLFDKRGSYTLEIQPGGRLLFTSFSAGQTRSAASTAFLAEDQWNHIALILDRPAGAIRFVLNGVSAGVGTANFATPFTSSPWPLIFGSERILPVSRTPEGLLDDVRLYTRVLSLAEIALLAHPEDPSLEPNLNRDSDALNELEEYLAGSNPLLADTDGDGLSDSDERLMHGTDPRLPDSDGDDLSDSYEINTLHTNPLSQDTDGDYLNDYEEVVVYGTSSALTTAHGRVDREGNPRSDGWDSDGDGIPDGWEVYYQFDPASAGDKNADPDGDGITNYQEYLQEKWPHYADDVSVSTDSDGDKLSDWAEKYVHHTNPNNADSFGDGLGDLYRVKYGLLNIGNPNHAATGDMDGDGSTNKQEQERGSSPLDPKNLTAVAIEAVAVAEKPHFGKIAHNAPSPEPLLLPGTDVALAYKPGDLVFIDDKRDGEIRLIAAVDRISVKALGAITEPREVGGSVKNGLHPSPDHLGEPAEDVYTWREGYNITAWVKNLPVDENGLVHFRIVAEVDPLFEREPAPPAPGDPQPPGNPGTGGVGGGGWGWGWIVGGESGRGSNSTQLDKQQWRPPGKPTYALSQISAYIVRSGLRVDYNRDGSIMLPDEDATDATTTDKPFCFWSNDDDDNPAPQPPYPAAPLAPIPDYTNTTVDGPDDLKDFFPVFLDLKQLLEILPPSATTRYKLKHAEGAFNFSYTSLTRASAFSYLTDTAATYGPSANRLASANVTERITATGVYLDAYGYDFLNGIKDQGRGVILVEMREMTAEPLRLVVEKDGVEIAEVSLPLVPVQKAPDYLEANTDFDERKLLGGFVRPDSADPELAAISGPNVGTNRIEDLHEGFFGLPPGVLPYAKTSGATVKIRKVAKNDPVLDAPQSGEVRLHRIGGSVPSQAEHIELYDPVTLEGYNIGYLYNAPLYPYYTKYYLEGVKPGRITLEFSFQRSDLSFKFEQEFIVTTRKSRADWLNEITEQIKLETGVDMHDYALGKKFIDQKAQIQQVYRFYEGLHHRNPEVQRWGGLAKRAGCAVYGGFSDMQRFLDYYPNAFPLIPVTEPSKAVALFLQDVLVEGGYNIYHDLAWQSRAYERGGYYALEFTRLNGLDTGAGVIRTIDLDAWLKIAQGDAGADTTKILDGVLDLTRREQWFVVQPSWDRVIDADPTDLLGKIISILTKNPIPTEPAFLSVFPGKNIAVRDDRWPWVTTYMLPPWGLMNEPSRNALVDDPLINAASDYSLLFPLIPILP